jgi:predicted nucleic acid-binding protein
LSKAIFLDTGPLGLLAKAPSQPEVIACNAWMRAVVTAGHDIYLPEIADYELRRKLLHLGSASSITRLDQLKVKLKYVPITTDAMLLAADLWAQARRSGLSTADPKAIDADVILAGQALTRGVPLKSIVVVTSNPGHLSRVVAADLWQNILP